MKNDNSRYREILFPLLFFFALFDFTDLPFSTSILGITSKLNLSDIGIAIGAGWYIFLYREAIADQLKSNIRIVSSGLLFLSLALFSCLHDNPFWFASFKYWIKIHLFFFALIILFRTSKTSGITISVLCVIFIIINAIGIAEFVYFNTHRLDNFFSLFRSKDLMLKKFGVASIFPNQNWYGIINSIFFLSIMVIKINFKKLINNRLCIPALLLSLCGIFLSLSLDAILTMLLGSILIAFKSLKTKEALKWTGISLIIFLLVFVISIKYNKSFNTKYGNIFKSTTGVIADDPNSRLPSGLGSRLKIWDTGIELFREKPVFGWGTRMSYSPLKDLTRRRHMHMHNCYLEILVNNGIAGFTLFILLIALWLRRIKGSILQPVVYSLLFSCLFGSFLGSASWIVFTAWITALSTGETFMRAPESNHTD